MQNSDTACATRTHNHNSKALPLITKEKVQTDIEAANTNYCYADCPVIEAAAHAYIIWREAFSCHATQAMINWTNSLIAERNAEIDSYNAKIKLTMRKAASQHRLNAHRAASDFAVVVRFVFNLRKKSDAVRVAGYVNSLREIHELFESKVIHSADEIVRVLDPADWGANLDERLDANVETPMVCNDNDTTEPAMYPAPQHRDLERAADCRSPPYAMSQSGR